MSILNSANCQTLFRYSTYINGVWDDWNSSNSMFITGFGYHVYIKGSLSNFIIYQNNRHPSNYLVKIQSPELEAFLKTKDFKKRLKESFKNDNNLIFQGTLEFADPLKFTDQEGLIKPFLENFPVNLPVNAKSIQKVKIILHPFKKTKDSKTMNIFFENDQNMGLALIFN